MYLNMEKDGRVAIRNMPVIAIRFHNDNLYVDKYDDGGEKQTLHIDHKKAFVQITEKEI